MSKPKVAIYWAAACGGCDTKILDIDEKILDVAAAVDLVFWPIAMDFKYKDVEAMADGEIDLCVICLLYTSPSPRDLSTSRMPSSA